MSEETKSTEGGLSGLKKTLIGTLTTAIAGGGVWLSTFLGGHHEAPKEGPKTEQTAPAAAPITINLSQNQANTQQQKGGTTTVIKEKVVEKKETKKEEKKSETENAPW
jgi:hypothetical protein